MECNRSRGSAQYCNSLHLHLTVDYDLREPDIVARSLTIYRTLELGGDSTRLERVPVVYTKTTGDYLGAVPYLWSADMSAQYVAKPEEGLPLV